MKLFRVNGGSSAELIHGFSMPSFYHCSRSCSGTTHTSSMRSHVSASWRRSGTPPTRHIDGVFCVFVLHRHTQFRVERRQPDIDLRDVDHIGPRGTRQLRPRLVVLALRRAYEVNQRHRVHPRFNGVLVSPQERLRFFHALPDRLIGFRHPALHRQQPPALHSEPIHHQERLAQPVERQLKSVEINLATTIAVRPDTFCI